MQGTRGAGTALPSEGNQFLATKQKIYHVAALNSVLKTASKSTFSFLKDLRFSKKVAQVLKT